MAVRLKAPENTDACFYLMLASLGPTRAIHHSSEGASVSFKIPVLMAFLISCFS